MFATPRSRALTALLVAAFLFGATFVVVKAALESVPPLSFVAWRFLVGTVALGVLALPRGRGVWLHGALAGSALFGGYALQTAGLALTSASNSALITGLYVVFTPFLVGLFHRRAPRPWVVVAAAVSFAGLVLLTGGGELAFQPGDLLTVGCALSFALHIVALARYARLYPVVPFTTVQLATTSVLAFLVSAVVERTGFPPPATWSAIALTGLGVSVGAFLLQVWAQTVVGPGTTAVVLAAEPAFGVATAWVVLGERLQLEGWVGAALIVAAIQVVITKQRDETAREAEAVTPAH